MLCIYVRTLAPVADVSGWDRWLHSTVFRGKQLLVPAWCVCFWCQSPQMLTLIFMILIFTILDAKWIDLCHAVRLLDDLQCAVWNGSVHISVLDGALWDAWQVRCEMGEIGLSLSLFNRSVQIPVWYLWCWDLFYVILVCIRLHVIFVSCDCIMKCIFVWTQVVNKLLLLLDMYWGNIIMILGTKYILIPNGILRIHLHIQTLWFTKTQISVVYD